MSKLTAAKTPVHNMRNIWAVTLTSFLTDISSEMLTNLIPLFLFNVLGVRTSIIGLIEGSAEATASLLKVFSGWLADKIGKRKALAVFGYSISTIAKPFLFFATHWSGVLGVRFADRVGKGIRTSPRDSLLADSAAEGKRGFAFGLHRAGDTAGAVIGLSIALGVILISQGDKSQLTRATFQQIVLLSLIPAVLAVFTLAVGAKEIEVKNRVESLPSFSFSNLGHQFRYFLIVTILFTLGNSSVAFLILRAQDVGSSITSVLGIMILYNFVYALISGPAGALSDRWGRRKLLVLGWIVFILVYLGFAIARVNWQIWILMGMYGLHYGLTEGVARAYVADLVPSGRRGTAYGIYNASIGLVAFPSSFIAGLLWQGVGDWGGFGPSGPFLFGAGFGLIAVLLLVNMPRWTNNKFEQA